MKRIILTLAIIITAVWNISALVHTVQRGETLQSIAQAYHLTTQQLIDANPGADQLFFVGLKLNIPEVAAAQTPAAPAASSTATTQQHPQSGNVFTQTVTGVDDGAGASAEAPEGSGWGVFYDSNFGFLEKVEGVSNNSHWTLSFSVGGSYWFTQISKGAYAAFGIGYEWISRSYSYKTGYTSRDEVDWNLHLIYVPIRLGYRFVVPSEKFDFGVTPYLGIDAGISVAAKYKVNKEKIKTKTGQFFPSFKPGLMLSLGSLDLGFYYRVPLGDKAKGAYDKDGHFGVSLGWGF